MAYLGSPGIPIGSKKSSSAQRTITVNECEVQWLEKSKEKSYDDGFGRDARRIFSSGSYLSISGCG